MQKEHVGPIDFVQTEQTDFSLSWHTQDLNTKGKERLPQKDLHIIKLLYLGLEAEGQVKIARGSPECLKLSEFYRGSKICLKETLVMGFSV